MWRWLGVHLWCQWVMYRIVESLYCTPETNITLYVNYTEIKIKTIKIK